jgi:Protein of unknown function (DUF1638)
VIILACGALYRELQAITAAWPLPPQIYCLPAALHNHPQHIAPRLAHFLPRLLVRDSNVVVAYADCGSYGAIAKVCAQFNVPHLAGDHCYAFYGGLDWFARYHAANPTLFYVTDFLVQNFDRTVMAGLGLDRHPQLRDMYFAHYTGVVYLQQNPALNLTAQAELCAQKLGLPLHEVIATGYGALHNITNQRSADRQVTPK